MAEDRTSSMTLSRSPSPLPPPPTSAAPGPRAAALQKLYADAVAHVLRTCSYPNFSSCFPTPARQVPGSVKYMHEQFIAKLGESMHKEFHAILAERNVLPSLNELDRLIEEARRRKAKAAAEEKEESAGKQTEIVPPHTLPAKQLYISHLAPSLSGYASQMKLRHDELASENHELLKRVMQQRQDIKRLMDGLDNVVGDLTKSAEAMDPDAMMGLREECRGVEESMR